jgi:serine/threonine protein kinase
VNREVHEPGAEGGAAPVAGSGAFGRSAVAEAISVAQSNALEHRPPAAAPGQATITFAQPNSLQYMELEKLAHHFTEACEQAGAGAASVDLNLYLPPAGDSARLPVLHELIKTHLEICWGRGIRATLADYVVRFPELGTMHGLSARLVYEEYRVRQLYGDKPGLAAYKVLFPNQFDELQQLEKEQPVHTVSSAAITLAGDANKAPQPPGASSVNTVASCGSTLAVGHDYKFLRRLGTGAFGEVWHAEAPGGIDVAVKIITQSLDHEEAQRELQALERIKMLRHPYLLQTQAFWPKDDRLYIAMDLAEFTLRERLKQCRALNLPGIPQKELHRYISEAAEALDYLHEQQVIHRDIKPENILVLQGHAKVADFGLVCRMQSQHATSSGTPAYMAPEVWRGKVSVHSDQYSLAVTYAEMRMDRRLFQADTLADLMFQHLEGDADLGSISLGERGVLCRALSKDPERRYGSCQEFSRALGQALTTDNSPARKPSRLPQPKALAPVALLAIVCGLVFLLWSSFGVWGSPSVIGSVWPIIGAVVCLAFIAISWLARQLGSPSRPEPVPEEAAAPPPTVASSHTQGGQPAAGTGQDTDCLVLGDDGASTAMDCLVGHTDSIWGVAFSPDGYRVVSASMDQTACLWDLTTGQELRRFTGHADGVTSVAIARDGQHVLTGSLDNTLRWWDVEAGREIRRLVGHADSVLSVALSPDDRLALSGSADGTVRLWHAASGKEVRRFEGHTGRVYAVAFAPDGRSVVSAGEDGTLRLWDVGGGEEVHRFTGHVGAVHAAAFAPDGRLVASGGTDRGIHLWDVNRRCELGTLPGHTDWVRGVVFTPDGRHILSGGDDETVRLHDPHTGGLIQIFEGHTWSVLAVAVSADGLWAVSGSDDATLRFWTLEGAYVRT